MSKQENKQAEQVERERLARIERANELDDIRFIMKTKVGRRFMWRLLTVGNIFRKCFTGNSNTFYQEGKREMTLEFYQDIMEASPDQFAVAQKENWKAEKKE